MYKFHIKQPFNGITQAIVLSAIPFLMFGFSHSIFLIFLLLSPVPLFLLFYGLYRLSYTITITPDGKMIEKQFFRNSRELLITELNLIKGSEFNLPFLFFTYLAFFTNYGAKLENDKYTKFPRYAMPNNFITTITSIQPNINIDANYQSVLNQSNKFWGSSGFSISKIVILLVSLIIVIPLVYSVSRYFQEAFNVDGPINTVNISDCDGVRYKNRCLSNVANNTEDPNICKLITNNSERGSCYSSVAFQQKNIFICNNLQVKQDGDFDDKDSCIIFFATHSKDYSYCSKVSKDSINDFNSKESCYQEVAKSTKNADICNMIKSQVGMTGCYLSLAINLRDPSVCNGIKIVSEKKFCVDNYF